MTIDAPKIGSRNYGLVPRPLPLIHPKSHQLFGTPDPVGLPATFDVGDVVGPVDQGDTAFCSCYTTRELISDIDGVAYDENWNVAMTGKLNGGPILGGASAQDAMQAMVGYGGLLKSLVPPGFDWESKGPAFIADYKNWDPTFFLDAAQHEQPGFVAIDGPYDAFDNLCSQMYQQKRSAALATKWFYNLFNAPGAGGIVPTLADNTIPDFTYHMYTTKGWIPNAAGTDRVIKIKPYEGANYGVGGYSYMDRETINNLYGGSAPGSAFMFAKVPPTLMARLLLQNPAIPEEFRDMLTNFLESL